MDYKTLIKNLDISWAKVGWLMLFNSKGLYEYVLSKANTAVNLLLEANVEVVNTVRERLGKFIDLLRKYEEYIPAPWRPYADAVNVALISIYAVTEDHHITSEEATEVVNDFRAAFSAFMAD
ncbi:MAG: hypothetical protein ACI305_05910 [Lepagella sp.]